MNAPHSYLVSPVSASRVCLAWCKELGVFSPALLKGASPVCCCLCTDSQTHTLRLTALTTGSHKYAHKQFYIRTYTSTYVLMYIDLLFNLWSTCISLAGFLSVVLCHFSQSLRLFCTWVTMVTESASPTSLSCSVRKAISSFKTTQEHTGCTQGGHRVDTGSTQGAHRVDTGCT